MHTDRWNDVARLVEAALDERAEDRRSWLLRNVGQDTDLLALALKTLEEHERVDRYHFLGGGNTTPTRAPDAPPRSTSPPSTLRFRSSSE